MIQCANCGHKDHSSFRGLKSEEKYIRVLNTNHDDTKRFFCGLECYVDATIRAEYLPQDDDRWTPDGYKEYREERYQDVRSYLLSFASIQDYLKRNPSRA